MKKGSIFWMIDNNVKNINVSNAIKGYIGNLLLFKHRSEKLEEYLKYKRLNKNFEWWLEKQKKPEH
ncbi:hypothetical protein ACQCVB_20140 [Fictibacillus phosphorivorans]|uniref:hypothetical protein n=1 Tax=Fictibacillus phosphorivorans TaxID=1221500 RepID=UPI003CF745D0